MIGIKSLCDFAKYYILYSKLKYCIYYEYIDWFNIYTNSKLFY